MADGIAARGGASEGHKTMLDAWRPAAVAARDCAAGGGDGIACLAAASKAAQEGSDSTAEMKSQMGRSKKLGDRSIGHIDPGAASAAILIAAMTEALRNANGLE